MVTFFKIVSIEYVLVVDVSANALLSPRILGKILASRENVTVAGNYAWKSRKFQQ